MTKATGAATTAPTKARAKPAANPKPARAFGRSIGDFPKLNAAEKKLIACCARGDTCVLGDGERPEEFSEERKVRAGLIRFFILGGDDETPVHERGVDLKGAWIVDELDLHCVTACSDIALIRCNFREAVVAYGARLASLLLTGSYVPALEADGLVASGNLFLRNGFVADGGVRLLGAQIGGNLELSDGHFSAVENGRDIQDRAFFGQALTVRGGLLLTGKSAFKGAVDLTSAHVGTLADEPTYWPASALAIDGFRYEKLVSRLTDGANRTRWLEKQFPGYLTTDFRPQPWEQLIKVLREMGHPDEAEQVAIAKQRQWRIAQLAKLNAAKEKGEDKSRIWNKANWWIKRGLHWLYGVFVGYGYRPMRVVYSMLGLWFVCSLIFQAGAAYNYLGPSTPLLNNPQLAAQIEEQCGHAGQPTKTNWTKCPAVPAEYTTFYAPIYSLDLILPLVDLQQERDWAPIVSNEKAEPMYWGRALRWVMWLEILLGWVASLTLVAVLGRLVEKD